MSDARRAGVTTTGTDDAPVPRGLVVVAAGGMLLLALVLRHYGLDLVDEGTLLAQTERVRTGQWPYRDFHTGYGPASFALNASLLTLFGVHIEVVRIGLAVTHAIALAALTVLAARALGALAAATVLALTVSFFLPIAPGLFAVWNIPYPSWYAQAIAAIGLLAALTTDRRGAVALLASGICMGVAFCFKQNTGVLGLAGVLVWRAFERSAPEGRGSPVLGIALAVAVAAGGVAIVAAGLAPEGLGPTGTFAIALPVLVLAWRVALLRPSGTLWADAAWLTAGFAAVVVPLVLGLVWAVGVAPLARQLLHVGSGAASIYGAPYPGASELASAIAAASSGWRGMRKAMDVGWLFVLPAGQLIAVLRLRSYARTPTWRLLVPSAVLFYVQLYPRADLWHLLPMAGLSVVVALGALLHELSNAGATGRRLAVPVLGMLMVVAAVRWVPNVGDVRAALSTRPPSPPAVERAAIRWDLASSPALRAVPDVVHAVAGAPQLVGFPALSVFNFLAGIPSPLRHDYFFPRLLSDAEEQAIAAELERVPQARIVVLHDSLAFFSEAFASHAVIAAAIERDFARVRQVGPYEVREAAP